MLTGRELTHLMRIHRITIRTLAVRLQVTQQRVREVRARGLSDPSYVAQTQHSCHQGQ